MHLLDLLSPARVRTGVAAGGRKRLLEVMASLLADGSGDSEAVVFETLCGRERLGSTGLGHGVAIPHARSQRATAAAGAFVRLAEPVDFGSPDGEPVDLVFAVVVPDDFAQQHLLLLAELAEMFGDAGVRERLRAAPAPADVLALLADWQAHRAAA